MPHKPTFAITLGDPTGIGPEIVAKSLKDPKIKKLAHWKILGLEFKKVSRKHAGTLSIEALQNAVKGLKAGKYDGLVTAPISKIRIKEAGFKFPGHTEYLAHSFKTKKIAMMLAAPNLRVVLTTIHIPLKKIFTKIKPQLVLEKIVLTHESLKKDFGISKPKIAVCGINPHAGEGEMFGNEEKKLIVPAIKQAKKRRILISGPHSADTIFHHAVLGDFDAVICHYHDQGLAPLKTLSFHEGVNITLGLPIIRTSPDHGCAFDIAGTGLANPSSMKAAMRLAVKVYHNRKKEIG